MEFRRVYFDPAAKGGVPKEDGVSFRSGDGPDDVYVFSHPAILALNVALATGRPLLVSGEPGSGKTSLARHCASVLGWWYYERVVTSRTQASDLLWSFDALRRLNDATLQGQTLLPPRHYVDPGPLWWAFDPETAAQRGTLPLSPTDDGGIEVRDPGVAPADGAAGRAVVLLDEIDKADPDVPNDLLEPFGSRSFTVRDTGDRVRARREVLLVLTTNGERELPPAFLRRCVVLTLEPPTAKWFVGIAERKLGSGDVALYRQVADRVMSLRAAAARMGLREPSTGEFLDAVAACRGLGVHGTSQVFDAVTASTLWKHEKDPAPVDDDRDDGP
jgi:MoxR-like ATPase